MIGNSYNYLFSNILITFIMLWFILQVIVDKLEYIIFLKYMSSPFLVQGEIREICRATIQGKRMSHYSGVHYVVVEYQYESITCHAKILRTKNDYVSRKVMLALDKDNRNIVVRTEYERAYKYPSHYLLLFFIPLIMLYYSNGELDIKYWIWAFITIVVSVIMYNYRTYVMAHIYMNRQQEWINKSIIKPSGELPGGVTGTVFFICLLFIIFLILYLPNSY